MWWLGAGLLVGAAAVVAVWRRHELAQAFYLISRVRVPQLAVAVGCEALSVVCFAAVPRRLLLAGGVRWSLRRMTAIVVAANAVAGALPGGAAFATAWVYRQLSRRGVEPVLGAAVLVVAGALSALGLAILTVLGMFTVGAAGAAAVVRPVAGVLVLALVIGLAVFSLSRFAGFRAAVRRAWFGAGGRSRRVRQAQLLLVRVVEQARSLQPGFRPWLRPAAYAALNWGFDAACLAACLWALGIGVPWRGILLAYALTQIPGSLRLTPGSIGVVEASLSALLVLYGLPPGPAIAGVLLYRAISYWALQPVGWANWIGVTFQADRPSRRPGRRKDCEQIQPPPREPGT
ncbi:lysylphosphatidylglycerol synthase transmembrane domain-containing protein [Streptomyces sp. JV185]|uniref:lysylphosphatidylglycerol synthase transmembrane domain-containing protein n=1 Tax=Streptomyces sp. JV185 TaxID=858638 RepID=UPI002E798965|nr:lysylphosphatidylglycerol synthase transmembrane domain-containing protein [Streptomyces sp. JV185]MEE1769102.1 lysylphosphatidylglycerol synthase transmembrane domain-containing protein [Streptomyces sp. JV185]